MIAIKYICIMKVFLLAQGVVYVLVLYDFLNRRLLLLSVAGSTPLF